MKEVFSEEEGFSRVLKIAQDSNKGNESKVTECRRRNRDLLRATQHEGAGKGGDGDNCGFGMNGGGTVSAKPRSPARNADTGSVSVEMRQATDRSGITHGPHCSLPFMPGLAETVLLIWDILFCF